MAVIYEPKGKAREYSPLALNVYEGCTHRCKYCYAPKCKFQSAEFYYNHPVPRTGIIERLKKELHKGPVPNQQVLLSFIGDLYCETIDHGETAREVLELLYQYKVPTAILTKGGSRCLKDMDLFQRFAQDKLIQVGATLTFMNEQDSLIWESGAAWPQNRLDTLKELHEAGIETFASFEPVIDPEQSLQLIKASTDFIDIYKIGKINNYQGLDKGIDWTGFLGLAVDILRQNDKKFYIKVDLRKAAPSIQLTPQECSPDLYTVKGLKQESKQDQMLFDNEEDCKENNQ